MSFDICTITFDCAYIITEGPLIFIFPSLVKLMFSYSCTVLCLRLVSFYVHQFLLLGHKQIAYSLPMLWLHTFTRTYNLHVRRCFYLTENARLEQAAAVDRFVSSSGKRTHESIIELGISGTFYNVLVQCSPQIFKVIARITC